MLKITSAQEHLHALWHHGGERAPCADPRAHGRWHTFGVSRVHQLAALRARPRIRLCSRMRGELCYALECRLH